MYLFINSLYLLKVVPTVKEVSGSRQEISRFFPAEGKEGVEGYVLDLIGFPRSRHWNPK